VALDAHFNAVGALRESLLAGQLCDVLIATDAIVDALVSQEHLCISPRALLGLVHTGLAAREADAVPDVSSGQALAGALRSAAGLYFPDPERATAGAHFAGVLERLGIRQEVAARCRTFANGFSAMRALAASNKPGELGCTQLSEIMFTPGLRSLGTLPAGFGLATAYTAAVARSSISADVAAGLVEWLASERTRSVRAACGFDVGVPGA
jgi:molybdate transport system substrate-binding protein